MAQEARLLPCLVYGSVCTSMCMAGVWERVQGCGRLCTMTWGRGRVARIVVV